MSFRKKSDPIGYLLHREFPYYQHLKGLAVQPISMHSAPVEPEEKERRASLLKQIEQREGELRTLQLTKPQEFQQVLDTEMAKETAELQRRAEREEQERFFNQPHASADFDHWGNMPIWSIDEAVALWFGKEPTVVRWENIESMTQISAFAKQFSRKREIAKRAALVNEIGSSNYPSAFIAWANRIGPKFPDALEAKVRERGPIADWHTLYDQECSAHAGTQAKLAAAINQLNSQAHSADDANKALDTRERNSLLYIIGAMASDANISLGEPYKTGQFLAKTLEDKGINIGGKTIGNHLKAADELLSGK